MESFEGDGAFWLDTQPERPVVGRLRYEPADGASLRLFGSVADIAETLGQEVKPLRLNGVAGSKKLTLDGCYHSGTTVQSPGIDQHTYKVLRILAGAHFASGDELAFDEVAVSFDQLPSWVDKSGFTLEVDTMVPNDFSTATQIRLKYDVFQPEVVQADDCELALNVTWSFGGDRLATEHITQQVHMKIKYSELRSLGDILADVNGLQDLITLAADAPSVPTEIKLWRPDVVHETAPGRSVPLAIDLYHESIAEHVREEAAQPRHRMFFPFDQIGGLEVVGRWLATSRKYRPVLGALLTIRYSVRLYAENRYYNVISAAETFHRMRFSNAVLPRTDYRSFRKKIVKIVKAALGAKTGKWVDEQLAYSNEPRLKARLVELAEYAGEAFVWLVGDAHLWAKIVTNARNPDNASR